MLCFLSNQQSHSYFVHGQKISYINFVYNAKFLKSVTLYLTVSIHTNSNKLSEFFKLFQVIAENLSKEEIQGLKAMFTNMDTDKSGTITYDELKEGLKKLGSKLTEAEVRQLMEAVKYSKT